MLAGIMSGESTDLNLVALYFGVSTETIEQWRAEGCPALSQAPYDVIKIAEWRKSRIEIIKQELEIEKMRLEIEKLEKDNRQFTKDPTFWIAAITLGLQVSSNVREWLKVRYTQQNHQSSMWDSTAKTTKPQSDLLQKSHV